MSEYEIVQNHLIFEQLGSDSLGTDYRAGKIIDNKAEKHSVLSEIHPYISSNPKLWKSLQVLLEGVKNSKFSSFYCPEEVIEEDDKAFLVYPFLRCRTFEDILKDSIENDDPIDIDITFSIAITIADILDQGSGIKVNKIKSYHGLLTPDNIMIDMDGKIILKNYGIFPFLGKIPELTDRLNEKYSSILPPEWIRQEQLSPQTDIYFLGNIIYRMLTGEYFTYSPDEDFESKVSAYELSLNIIPPEEGNFEENILTLFKKTLNPDPAERFSSIKEFSEFLSNNFQVNEVSAATFVIAYFMNFLYMKTTEKENKQLKKELAYEIPVKEEAVGEEISADYLREEIEARLEEQRRTRPKFLIPLIIVIIIAAGIIGFQIINQQKQAKERRRAEIERAQELERSMAKFKEEIKSEYERRLKTIEDKAALTEEEKNARDVELKKLEEWRQLQEKKSQEQLKKLQAALAKKNTPPVTQKKPEVIEKKPEVIEQKPEVTEQKPEVTEQKPEIKETPEPKAIETPKTDTAKPKNTQPGPGNLVELSTVTFTPNKLRGKSKLKADTLGFPDAVNKKYQGQNLALNPELLISEAGSIIDVKFKENLPPAMVKKLTSVLKKWRFFPAEVNKVKVKVWYPTNLSVSFPGTKPPTQIPPKPKVPVKLDTVPLNSISFRPSKLSGKSRFKASDLDLSRAVRKKYSGQILTVNTSILIDKFGIVRSVKHNTAIPQELKMKITEALLKWRYVPAERDKVKVNVWFPTKVTITF
jgi:hypothetical protein